MLKFDPLDLDLSAVEERALSWMEGPTRDLHVNRAAELFGVTPEEVTKSQRQYAKERNFFDLYSHPMKLRPLGDDNE